LKSPSDKLKSNSKKNNTLEIDPNSSPNHLKKNLDEPFFNNSNSTLKSQEYYNLYYQNHFKSLFQNSTISEIYQNIQEELHHCIYCCCSPIEISNIHTTTNKKSIVNNNLNPELEYSYCSSLYNVLHYQLEDIIIKLYLELITTTEEDSHYSELYSHYSTLNLDTEQQRLLYINNFDTQSFLSFLLNYPNPIITNQRLLTKFINYLHQLQFKKNILSSSINTLSHLLNFNDFFNYHYKTPTKKMSGKQYTNEYAVKVTKDVDAKELAEKLGLSFGGQIGELEGYYLYKVDNNNDINDENVYRNIETNLSKEKNIEWFERQYLKTFQKRSVF